MLPGTIMAAAVLWLVVGSLILLAALALLVLSLFLGRVAETPFLGTAALPVLVIALLLLLGLVGVVFLRHGVQTLRGTQRDTLGAGIFSIVVGLLFGTNPVQGGLAGLALIAAGILALVGRRDYLAWRQGRRGGARASDRPPGRSTQRLDEGSEQEEQRIVDMLRQPEGRTAETPAQRQGHEEGIRGILPEGGTDRAGALAAASEPIDCLECGSTIPAQATRCPNCGRPRSSH
jgi:hypothetical protein